MCQPLAMALALESCRSLSWQIWVTHLYLPTRRCKTRGGILLCRSARTIQPGACGDCHRPPRGDRTKPPIGRSTHQSLSSDINKECLWTPYHGTFSAMGKIPKTWVGLGGSSSGHRKMPIELAPRAPKPRRVVPEACRGTRLSATWHGSNCGDLQISLMADLSNPPVPSDTSLSKPRHAPLLDRRELYSRNLWVSPAATRRRRNKLPSADQLTRVCLQKFDRDCLCGHQLPWHLLSHGEIPKNWPALGGSSSGHGRRRSL
jgi:hypothetical protein